MKDNENSKIIFHLNNTFLIIKLEVIEYLYTASNAWNDFTDL